LAAKCDGQKGTGFAFLRANPSARPGVHAVLASFLTFSLARRCRLCTAGSSQQSPSLQEVAAPLVAARQFGTNRANEPSGDHTHGHDKHGYFVDGVERIRASYRSKRFAGSCGATARRLTKDRLQSHSRGALANDPDDGRFAARSTRLGAGRTQPQLIDPLTPSSIESREAVTGCRRVMGSRSQFAILRAARPFFQ